MSLIDIECKSYFVTDDLPKWNEKHQKKMELVIKKITFDMVGQVKYRIQHQDRIRNHKHFPGEGAIDNGDMIGSVWGKVGKPDFSKDPSFPVREVKDEKLVGYAGVGKEYAGYVEWGTMYMDARPFFRPSFDDIHDKLIKFIKEKMQ